MNQDSPPPPLGEEKIPPGESAQIDEIVSMLRAIQEERDRRQTPVPRTVHSKQHGCVFGEFTVEPGLPDELRHGVFNTARTYEAVIRFSNAKQRDDRLPDGHGVAIKLLDVDGTKLLEAEATATTQDFVLVDHPVFFARDVADMVPLMRDFQRLMLGGAMRKAGTALKGLLSPNRRFRLLRRMGTKRPDNPLAIQYWSTTPFRLGPGAVKFSLRPQTDGPPLPAAKSADKLRLALAAHLRERDARFDFLVQRQTDPVTMPIEDATIAWDEEASPYRKVGTLRIPQQTPDSPEQLAFGEQLSFTPWHAIAAHQPLGGINRARRKIYEAMSARRLELNGVAKHEPTREQVRAVFGSLPT